ncbi:Bug family tripartite tricarboxylate transporter substrate binding protein [Ottowia testudinis]|uniref:Tripartite tricarboxylate transporter substrate binding protein n=1 Tax=Ottowia testudinis TaxID=2816950 RepID=A0A975H471_9BURK|nr:tripartite tricarboxylate transporter substrate binding protein [Ottowia testudinis]QTD46549.1 tripartite tricarboxylate transporter substrate binding protein [Ottowia testudinis]
MLKQRFLKLPLIAAALTLAATQALASAWPQRPIKLIVPYPAGGLTDVVSRLVGDELGRVLNTPIVIDNRAGAGGQIGLQALLQAPRDGYTMALVVPATMVTLPLTNPNYKIKPLDQLEPVTIAVDTFLTLVTDRKLGFKSVQDFVAYGKKHPGKMNYGTPGAGTSFHFNNVMMAQKLGIEAVHVPYNGEVQMLNDIVGGQLQYALVSNAGKNFIDGGQVSALAVTSRNRSNSLPNTPSFKELGVDFVSDGWVGYAVAKGTPPDIVSKLHAALATALNAPAVKSKLSDMGYQVVGNTPEQFRQIVRQNHDSYSALLQSGAVKLK